MGDCNPLDVLPQTVKRTDFIDHYVENEKNCTKINKEVNPKKNNLTLLSLINVPKLRNILILSSRYWRKKHGTNE
jgi:hypothetical protein